VADLSQLQKMLGVSFKNPALLELSLVHSSYSNENPDAGSNERLEFLGDAVIGFIIAEKLYRTFALLSEGEMTRIRAELVRQDTLAHAAESIKLGEFLYLGKGEEAGGGRRKPANLARAFEAVVGAVFLDRGLAAARKLVLTLLHGELEKAVNMGGEPNYKSQLQELVQAKYHVSPTYRLVAEIGPDHDKRFTVDVVIKDKVAGRGVGKSKKRAEMEAARLALKKLSHFTP
jgi:ribonuclease-3